MGHDFIGAANGDDEVQSVAVDNQGDVVAAGFFVKTGTGRDFTVVKFDRDGTLLWQRDLNGTANLHDEARAGAVDNHGNIVAAGETATDTVNPKPHFTVAEFDRDGTALWQQQFDGDPVNSPFPFLNNVGRSVAIDKQGNAVAAGVTHITASPSRFTVAKFAR